MWTDPEAAAATVMTHLFNISSLHSLDGIVLCPLLIQTKCWALLPVNSSLIAVVLSLKGQIANTHFTHKKGNSQIQTGEQRSNITWTDTHTHNLCRHDGDDAWWREHHHRYCLHPGAEGQHGRNLLQVLDLQMYLAVRRPLLLQRLWVRRVPNSWRVCRLWRKVDTEIRFRGLI